jgi:hypothetical protein
MARDFNEALDDINYAEQRFHSIIYLIIIFYV